MTPQRLIPTSFFAAAVFGALLGHLVWYTYFGYIPQPHPVSWRAPWVGRSGEAISQTYFRKKLYLSQPPRRAWVQVTAPEQFTFYVNGAQVGQERVRLQTVTAVYDITSRLQSGTNLLALVAMRDSHPVVTQVALEGEYEDLLGNGTRIATDGTWKMAPYRERQPDGGPQWFEVAFNDDAWGRAEVRGIPGPAERSRVMYPPWVARSRLDGRWIGAPPPVDDKSYFRYKLELASGVREAWLRIATQAGFALTVNGVQIAEQPGPADLGLPVERLNVEMYDVTRFLHTGANVLAVKTYTKRAERRLYVDGLVTEPSGREFTLATPVGWKFSTAPPTAWASPAYDDSTWTPSMVFGPIMPLDGPMTRNIAVAYPPWTYELQERIRWVVSVLLGTLGAVGLWLLAAAARARLHAGELRDALGQGGAAFALAAMFPIGVLMVGYDVRLDLTFAYRTWVILSSLGVLLVLQLILCLRALPELPADAAEPGETAEPPAPVPEEAAPFLVRHRWAIFIAVCLVAGLLLRLYEIDYEPLGPDESTGMLATMGVLRSGYPHYQISDLLGTRVSHTSELVPYAKALTVLLFGANEFGARLSSVIFGTLTIYFIFSFGQILFDRRVAAVAALAYTIVPAALTFSHYARYPAQLQFFSLVTAYLFYRAVVPERTNPRLLYLGVGMFILAYFSWEGVAFLLPGLFVGLLAIKRLNFRWLLDKHLWIAVTVIVLVIFFQQSARMIDQTGRMALGSGLADIAIAPLWLYPGYNPLAYFHSYLFTKNLQVISAAMLLGLLLGLRDRGFAYLTAVLFTPLFLTTNLLEAQQFRHVYYTMPFLFLSGVKTIFIVMDWLAPMGAGPGRDRFALGMRRLARVTVVVFLLLTANDFVLRLWNMPGYYTVPTSWLWIGDGVSMRGAANYIRQARADGAPIIAREPNWVYWHLKQVDMFLKTEGDLPAAVAEAAPVPVHRKSGVLLISNFYDLQQALNAYPRAWIVSNAVLGGLDRESLEFLDAKTSVGYENREVAVYRWQR
jgi:4-amino-4-deoxy-L-arabinose transferase-like glycosyltransferase